ncbi:MAG: hypothetical protein QNJ61_05750 [Desulfobacterales bacterium]|nr:hypothetical protein [Desulfobacterales bacterium]
MKLIIAGEVLGAGRNPEAAYRISYLSACGLALAETILLALLIFRWSPKSSANAA